MQRIRAMVLAIPVGLLAACATPAPVKQALVSLEENYAANAKLMTQYRDLVTAINTRHEYWFRYAQQRAKLDLALRWATTDPKGASVTDEAYTDVSAMILGADLVKFVNTIRLKGLPARQGSPSAEGSQRMVFQEGQADVDRLVQAIPGLIDMVSATVDSEYKILVETDLSPFEAYEKNVGVLRRINAVIKRYLDIDVTVAPKDVKEIADAVRSLR